MACHGQVLAVDHRQVHFGASAGEENWKTCVVSHCEGTEEIHLEELVERYLAAFVQEYSVGHGWKAFVQTDLRFSELSSQDHY